MSEISLKPCPFCGGELRQNMRGSYEDDNKECILYGFEIHKKFIPAWNTRKPVDTVLDKLEVLKNTPPELQYKYLTLQAAIEIVREELG